MSHATRSELHKSRRNVVAGEQQDSAGGQRQVTTAPEQSIGLRPGGKPKCVYLRFLRNLTATPATLWAAQLFETSDHGNLKLWDGNVLARCCMIYAARVRRAMLPMHHWQAALQVQDSRPGNYTVGMIYKSIQT